MPGSKSGFSVSHKYTEIKIQKIRYGNIVCLEDRVPVNTVVLASSVTNPDL